MREKKKKKKKKKEQVLDLVDQNTWTLVNLYIISLLAIGHYHIIFLITMNVGTWKGTTPYKMIYDSLFLLLQECENNACIIYWHILILSIMPLSIKYHIISAMNIPEIRNSRMLMIILSFLIKVKRRHN